MPQASQWMKRPPGASGSSRISTSDRVSAGGADHDSGGKRSSPSQVWRWGIVPPWAKALLVSENSATADLPCEYVAFRQLDGLNDGHASSVALHEDWAARPAASRHRRPHGPVARGQRVVERFAEDYGSFLDSWRRSIEAAHGA
jgi:hypothetical protein